MRKNVFNIQLNSSAHSLDEEFFACLENIIYEYDPESKIEVKMECKDTFEYIFDTFSEFYDYVGAHLVTIETLTISAKFPIANTHSQNSMSLEFNNKVAMSRLDNVKAVYSFKDSDNYFVLKNKIDMLLKSKVPTYSLLTQFTILPLLGVIVLVGAYIYTGVYSIVWPKYIQNLVFASSFILLLSPFLPFSAKLKRTLFPETEFDIGMNRSVVKKNASRRNYIGIGVIMTIVIGVLVNFISGLLF